MPIDNAKSATFEFHPKDSSQVKKSCSSAFTQSNSLHSFTSKVNTNFASSKSSNSLATEGLIENEELIEKLFPKCRPKPKNSITNQHVKPAMDSELNHSSDQHEMFTTNGTGTATFNGGEAAASNSHESRNGHLQRNYLSLQSKRLWNFMDISPSPSPPPLSSLNDLCGLDSHSHKNYVEESASASTGDKFALYSSSLFEQRLSPVGQQYPSHPNPISDCNLRDSFKVKGRFDINSLEVNKSLSNKATITNHTSSRKSSYYDQRFDGREANNGKASSHKHAHFRLDSLLLSPEERRDLYKQPKLPPNGIKKSNRNLSSESDQNDEDDVLFSRAVHTQGGSNCRSNSDFVSKRTSRENHYSTYQLDKPEKMNEKCHHRNSSIESNKSKSKEGSTTYPTTEVGHTREHPTESIEPSEEETEEEINTSTSRNRIEIAGGKEIFSSSRSARSKRRQATSHLIQNTHIVEQHGNSHQTRQAQLYTVNSVGDSLQSNAIASTSSSSQLANNKAKEVYQKSSSDRRPLPQPSSPPSSQSSSPPPPQSSPPTQQQQPKQKQYAPPVQTQTNGNEEQVAASGELSRYDQQLQQLIVGGNAEQYRTEFRHYAATNESVTVTANQKPSLIEVNQSGDVTNEYKLLSDQASQQLPPLESTFNNNNNIHLPCDAQSISELGNKLDSAETVLQSNVLNRRVLCNSSSNNNSSSQQPVMIPYESDNAHMSAATSDSATQVHDSLIQSRTTDSQVANQKSVLEKKAIVDVDRELCRQLEQSANLDCDQFTIVLKKKLDIVSNDHECDEKQDTSDQPENENLPLKLESTSAVLCSDSNFAVNKSGEQSPKSFETNERIARVIGSVPIAQYEGSPKRYGPKPGYPKRVISTTTLSNTNNNDYESVHIKKTPSVDCDHESAAHQTGKSVNVSALSSENGSPHSSTSSASSATFSSTDMRSSSSFSCPSNPKSANFVNWKIQSRLKESHCESQNEEYNNERHSSTNEATNNKKSFHAVADSDNNNKQQLVSCDEIVKSILSIPTGQMDTEDDVEEDVTSSSDKPNAEMVANLSLLNSAAADMSRIHNEPLYSSLMDHAGYSQDTNKSSGYSSKRSFHSDDNESLTKSKTSLSSNNGCDRVQTCNALGNAAFGKNVQTVLNEQLSSRNQGETSIKSTNHLNNFESRNVPKTLRLFNYPHYLETSDSFESTDSSYPSDRYFGKDFYYDQSDEDLYVFNHKGGPVKQLPGSVVRLNGNSTAAQSMMDSNQKAASHFSYTALSPELDRKELHSHVKLPTEIYESHDTSQTGNVNINTMPVLEDGLSSGLPSSDEMDYDDEDELTGQEHDLDHYVNEYNRRGGGGGNAQQCETGGNNINNVNEHQYSGRTEIVNGPSNGTNNGHNYNFHNFKQPPNEYTRSNTHKSDELNQLVYRNSVGSKSNLDLEMTNDSAGDKKELHEFYNGHHHHNHLNQHVHNHPVIDDDSRQSLSSPYNSNKHLSSSSGQEMSYGHDNYCLSSQLRSISNSSSNTSSMSTVRNATGQIGSTLVGPSRSNSPPPAPPTQAAGSQSAHSQHHHQYHHNHYHNQRTSSSIIQQSTMASRQNYPNLSSSPTSLSPNSPGMQHQSGSSSSSSSSSHPHHYHSQQSSHQHTIQASSQLEMPTTSSPSSSIGGTAVSSVRHHHDEDCDTDQETDRLLGAQRSEDRVYYEEKAQLKRSSTSREALPLKVLIEGVLFRARYLGSTQLVCDGQPTKATRMMQAEEAVSRIKAPEGETQPSTEVDLFISTEKIMVLNTDLKEIMMDHALRTISYIADIGDLLVLMARRRTPLDDPSESVKRIPKMICHVFESEEAQYIAQSIGQAFQVAYMEFLKANGIEDSSFLKEMDYQEVLNSQEIFGNELEMFAKREKQKEVIVPKQKGEILGIVIVESGWGSMLPTVVIANMSQNSPSARCGQLNIGDQIIAINGISLVGLPLSTCQAYVKNTKNQTAVKFTIVPCAPVVEVKIKRPDTKYQLGFSVQNGVICSLLRGGIAERGGVRVGHRIIEINGQSVVAVPHDRIVNLLATSVGEIHMKTMPTSMFRLLTGQDSPSYI